MADQERGTSLDVVEDIKLQRAEWRAARVLWFAVLGIMFASELGLFGNGPLSHAHAVLTNADLSVEYERLSRFGHSVRLIISAASQPDGFSRFTIDRDLLRAFQIVTITPEPDSTRIGDEGIEYVFRTDASRAPAVLIETRPAGRGFVRSEVRSPAGIVNLRQFIFP